MSEDKVFIGCKIIKAAPMSRQEFCALKGLAIPPENQPGYRVTYPDGYVSWSPKDAFENAYREITPGEREMVG
jgi:hypothetical protein